MRLTLRLEKMKIPQTRNRDKYPHFLIAVLGPFQGQRLVFDQIKKDSLWNAEQKMLLRRSLILTPYGQK